MATDLGSFYLSSVYCALANRLANRKVSISEAYNSGPQTQQCPILQVARNPCRGRFNTERTATWTSARATKKKISAFIERPLQSPRVNKTRKQCKIAVGFAKSPRLIVLNIDRVQFVLKNCEILHSVRGLYDKYSASWYCFTSDVMYKKYKRLVYRSPDLLARFCKVSLSKAKNWAWFVFQA